MEQIYPNPKKEGPKSNFKARFGFDRKNKCQNHSTKTAFSSAKEIIIINGQKQKTKLGCHKRSTFADQWNILQ